MVTKVKRSRKRLALILIPLVSLSAALTPAFAAKPNARDKFTYQPSDREEWERVTELIKAGKTKDVLGSKPSINPKKAGEGDEWKLNVSRALIALGYPIHAQYLLGGIVRQSIGTRQGFEALRMIFEVSKDSALDEIHLEELAFDLDTKVDEPESRSMIAYFQARSLFRKGYVDWASQSLTEVVGNSTWAEELRYDRILQTLGRGDTANAYGGFESLLKNPKARRPTATLSRLAVARLLFERKDYAAAIGTYKEIDLPVRERARVFNEMAWSYYYDRNYVRALGAIEALRSRYFQMMISPETYLLEMLIYRDLCYDEYVKQLADNFTKVFGEVYKSIELRKPLDRVPQFVQQILQEGTVQKRATIISKIRRERREIERQIWADDELRVQVLDQGDRRERITDAEIQRIVRDHMEPTANWFLDLREQVWFLGYEASLRMIQQDQPSIEAVAAPERAHFKPETLFWPLSDESWLDELLDYQVLIRPICGKRVQKASSGSAE